MTPLSFSIDWVLLRPCRASRVRLWGCQLPPLPLGWRWRGVKKGVYPFNKGPTPGPSQRELSHYLPTEPAPPGTARVGQILGAKRGGVLGRLSGEPLGGAGVQAPEPCWRGGSPGRQVSTPGLSWEVWGCQRGPAGVGGPGEGGGEEGLGRGPC